jgi:hypothetical protein
VYRTAATGDVLGAAVGPCGKTDLEAIGEVPDSRAVPIGVSDHHNFVALTDEALRQLVDVVFHTPKVGVEEVTDHADA